MRVVLLAEDVGGDRLGVDLIRALLALRPGATIEGMGGRPLAAAGLGLRWSAPNRTSGILARWCLPRVIARDLRKSGPDLVVALGAVPTLRGLACKPARIAAALGAVLDSPQSQRDAMRHALARLGAGGEDPFLRAARALLDGLPQAA